MIFIRSKIQVIVITRIVYPYNKTSILQYGSFIQYTRTSNLILFVFNGLFTFCWYVLIINNSKSRVLVNISRWVSNAMAKTFRRIQLMAPKSKQIRHQRRKKTLLFISTSPELKLSWTAFPTIKLYVVDAITHFNGRQLMQQGCDPTLFTIAKRSLTTNGT